MGKRRQESDIEKQVKLNKQRKVGALKALGTFLQRDNNFEILTELPSANAERTGDILWQLTSPGDLVRVSHRLRSAGINETEFADQVNAVLNLAHDKMIQPPTRRIIISNLLTILKEARGARR